MTSAPVASWARAAMHASTQQLFRQSLSIASGLRASICRLSTQLCTHSAEGSGAVGAGGGWAGSAPAVGAGAGSVGVGVGSVGVGVGSVGVGAAPGLDEQLTDNEKRRAMARSDTLPRYRKELPPAAPVRELGKRLLPWSHAGGYCNRASHLIFVQN